MDLTCEFCGRPLRRCESEKIESGGFGPIVRACLLPCFADRIDNNEVFWADDTSRFTDGRAFAIGED